MLTAGKFHIATAEGLKPPDVVTAIGIGIMVDDIDCFTGKCIDFYLALSGKVIKIYFFIPFARSIPQ